MKINDDHMYHGAILTQIAEHEQFTSINAVRSSKKLSRSAFRVNESIGVFVKYATNPVGNDYNFTFTKDNKSELTTLNSVCEKVFVAMTCIKDRQICCITLEDLYEWFEKRNKELRKKEDTSTVLVHLPKNKSFRVNMNMPNRKGLYLSDAQIVSRKQFPDCLFT